jgi:Xaa-Pro aminopeptidase
MPPSPDSALYSSRRKKLANLLGPGGVAIIPTASEQPRNRDSDFLFRHDSYFYYLTGFTEPNAFLVLFATGESTLFCQPKDLEREIWDGYRLGPECAVKTLAVDSAHPINDLDQQLPILLENAQSLWYPFSTHKGLTQRVDGWLKTVQSKIRSGISAPQQLRDLCTLLDEMRLFKDAHEVELMRIAGNISAQGHIRAMQFCAQHIQQNIPICEYHLDAELLYEFRRQGSEYPAYASIVAAGANACVLHYRADKAPINNGDLVLIDAGCEFSSYAGDITRTFPANGRFSKHQRALYDVVLESQYAAIAATRDGALFTDPHQAALRVLAKGLLELGILNSNQHGSVDDVIEHKHYFPYYMHRTSHWLGMDVHDCGSYSEPTMGTAPAPSSPRVLRAGMVLTIEPGLYIRPGPNVPEEFHNMGIRIEDDAMVTPKECELFSRAVPVDPLEIERIMS